MFNSNLICCLLILSSAAPAFAQVPMTGGGKGTPTVASGPVAVVAVSAEGNAGSGVVTSTTLTTDIGSTGNALVAVVSFNNTVTGLTVTWDSGGTNQAMTQIGLTTSASGFQNYFFGLLNPTAGNKTLALAWTTGRNVSVATVSFSGVNSTFGSAFNFQTNAGVSAASPATIDVTSATDRYTVAQLVLDQSLGGTHNQTLIFLDNSITQSVGAQYGAGAATVSYSWNYSGSGTWAYGAVDVRP